MNKLYHLLFFLCFSTLGAIAQPLSLTTLNTPYEQNFNTLVSSGSSSLLPSGWLMAESGSGAANNGLYIAGTGSGTAGDTYSFGAAAATDRAFGTLRSGTLIPTVGAGFVNNSGFTITSLQLQYQGEQWRLGTINRGSDRMDFQYSLDATTLLTGTWTNVDELDFIGPVNTGTTGALNGNANATTIAFEITGLNITDGQTVYFRWNDADVSGADDGLSIDNFSLIPVGSTSQEPTITFAPASLSFGDVNTGQHKTLSYEVNASYLEDSVTIVSDNTAFEVSIDNLNFFSSVSLPDSGGLVYVKFSPISNGLIETSVSHTSASYTKSLPVSGFGFEQASNIISIASARSKVAGTKITIAGRVTVANEQGNPAYLQDNTGGIPVFDFSLATGVQIGDSVIVTGPIGVFNDQKQISGSGIFFTKVITAQRLVTPKLINVSALAANEGLLVTVQNVELVNKSFVFYPQSTERLTDGTVEADLRIDGDTNIPGLAKPQSAVDITGVVGRFKTNAQLLPRFQADIPGAIEPSTETDSIARNKTLDVVNWNFEFFGAERENYDDEYGPSDEPLQLQNIKRVLDSLDADIIAVEEVSEEAFFATLVSQLGKYNYLCSQRYSYSFQGPSTFPPQKVCFIYDTTTVEILSARVVFEQLYDSARNIDPSLIPGYPTGDPSSFYSSGRLPYLIKAKTTIAGVSENISLIVIHAKSGATVNDYNRRLYDAKVLKDSLDQNFANEKVIILGDLNDDLDQSISTGLPTPYANFVADTSYSPITKVLSDANARSTVSFNDVIDHQIITSELNEAYLEGSAQIIAPFRYIPNYAATTSDHLPVISRYKFAAPIASFVGNAVAVTEDSTLVAVTITLSKPVSEDKTLRVSISGSAEYGSDFTTSPVAVNGLISLNLSAGENTASFTINILNDILDELSESASFTLLATDGIETGNNTFTLAIEDNDIPTISFLELYNEVQEGSSRDIKLKLSTPVASDQVIQLNVYDAPKTDYNVDYRTSPSVVNHKIALNISAGSSEVALHVDALTDKKRELLEVVTFYLAETTSGLQRSGKLISFLSIVDKKLKPHFIVFPNPTSDIIQLSCEEIENDQVIHAELRNNYGEKIFSGSGTLDELNKKLGKAIQHSRKGVYTLKVILENESFTIRVLKI